MLAASQQAAETLVLVLGPGLVLVQHLDGALPPAVNCQEVMKQIWSS